MRRSVQVASYRSGGKKRRVARYGRVARMPRMSAAGYQYVQSILNPSLLGAKIPDTYGAKTSTVQLVVEQKFPMTAFPGPAPNYVNIAGSFAGGILHVSAQPCMFKLTTGTIGSTTVAGWKLVSATGLPEAIALTDYLDAGDKLVTLFRAARVVSAGLKVSFSGSTNADQGTLTLFAVDRNHLTTYSAVDPSSIIGNPERFGQARFADYIGNDNTGTGTGAYVNTDNLRKLPLNAFGPAKLGGNVRWFPVDEEDTRFHPISGHNAASSTINSAATKFALGTVGALGFVAEGCDSTASVTAQFVVNLECIVRDDTIHLVSSEPSPIDPFAMASAAGKFSGKPQCVIGSAFRDTEALTVRTIKSRRVVYK